MSGKETTPAVESVPGLTAPRRELLLKQYDVFVGLFKTYCELIIKVTTWFFAITGATFTDYLANVERTPHLTVALGSPDSRMILPTRWDSTGQGEAA